MTHRTKAPGMRFKTLIPFLAIIFGQTWGLGILLTVFPTRAEALFGPMGYTNPIFILMVYSPAVAGLGLVLKHYGLNGVGRFLRRLTLWRMPKAWWAFLILGIPAIYYAAAALAGSIGGPFPFSPWYKVLPALATALVIGPIEEFGWRGVALPLLQRRFAPIWAALMLGAVWGIWHLPSFFMSGTPQSAWSFGPYFLGVLGISVILTQMFNSSRGSLLIAALFHFQVNGPVWPDAQSWGFVLFAIVGVIVLIVNRKAMFSRDTGVTDVLLPDTAATVIEAASPSVATA